MSIESEQPRIPQEGTDRYKVFIAITEEKAPVSDVRALAEVTGISTRRVTIARVGLRQGNYIPKPDPELTRLTQHTQAATTLPLVREYREMGLSNGEVQFAIKIETDKELSEESVHGAIVHNTKMGNIRRLTKEESRDIKRDVNTLSPNERLENVRAILEYRKYLSDSNLPHPVNRLEWKKDALEWKNAIVEDFYESRGLRLPVLSISNSEDICFANILICNRLVDNNLVLFEALKKIYEREQKVFDNLPPEVITRLEAFTSAALQEYNDDSTEPIAEFTKLGLQYGKEWFYNQNSIAVKGQRFIAGKIVTVHSSNIIFFERSGKA